MTMTRESWDLAIIGAGPGGYVAAIRAAQLGLKTVCIEKHGTLGGTCLNVGCIPSKALLESSERFLEARNGLAEHGISAGEISFDLGAMMARKDKIVQQLTRGVAFLLKKNKVATVHGAARFVDRETVQVSGEAETQVTAERFIIATGSLPATIPGVTLDEDRVGTSTEALAFDSVPKRLVVIGAGVIGLELGSVWRRLGADVTVVEYMKTVLPGADPDLSKTAHRLFKRQGLKFVLGAKVAGVAVEGDNCKVTVEGKDPMDADRVLVAVGRRPNTDALDLAAAGVQTDDRGFVRVKGDFETSAAGIFAIGDVIGGPMLAHKASDEGIACVEKMVKGFGHVNYDAVPSIVYTSPEVAWVGKTQTDLETAGVPFKVGTFNFKANGRALALGDNNGLVKVLCHADTDRLLGVHIIGPRAGDLLAEATVAIEYAASGEDLARAFHAHPTLSESLKEAALSVDGRAIHA
jgi:dihydrolipoamide dehydrogenase